MIEKKIGQKIRLMRKYHGLSQIELAGRIGVSFQQIQKYEKGSSGVSVRRLLEISEALEIPVAFFFGNEPASKLSDVTGKYVSETGPSHTIETLTNEEINLLKHFRMIRNVNVREGILRQLQGVAELEHDK